MKPFKAGTECKLKEPVSCPDKEDTLNMDPYAKKARIKMKNKAVINL